MSMERPQSANPMTEPALNAQLNASVHGLPPAAHTVVRALAYTANPMTEPALNAQLNASA